MKVFVSGCFDLLHAGHVAFLKEASTYGELHVCIGSDKTIHKLKGAYPLMSEQERAFIVDALACVCEVHIGSDSGQLDFLPELIAVKPDIFIVNEDGSSSIKHQVCLDGGIEYKVLSRVPALGLPERSSTSLKDRLRIPYRIALSGAWIDQPFMSEVCPGDMVVASIKPTHIFNERSGMATSSRKMLREIWGSEMPSGSSEKLAKILFAAENPPGSKYISGSQDMIGLTYPGITHMHYSGDYWPDKIESINDRKTNDWLESILYLIALWPRAKDFDPLVLMNIKYDSVKQLGQAGRNCWKAILSNDVYAFGSSLTESTEACKRMLPRTISTHTDKLIQGFLQLDGCTGAMITGAGGGGYLIVASTQPVKNSIKISIR